MTTVESKGPRTHPDRVRSARGTEKRIRYNVYNMLTRDEKVGIEESPDEKRRWLSR